MAPKAEQTTATPSPTKKSSKLWKRLSGGKSSKQKSANTFSSASPTTVTAMPMVAITVNGVTTCAVAADVVGQDKNTVEMSPFVAPPPLVESNGSNSPLVAKASKYTMQDNSNDVFPASSAANTTNEATTTIHNNNNNTASYFHSFISGHRLSFSEDEDCDEGGNDDTNIGLGGLVIQEVMRPTTTTTAAAEFVGLPSLEQQQVFLDGRRHGEEVVEEKWTPFGTMDHHEEDDHDVVVEMVVERSAEGKNDKPALSKTENASSEQQEPLAKPQQQPQPQPQPQQPNIVQDEDESLFQEVENIDTNINNQNINANANAVSPLADPPSTQRKTLTPEFFLGSGSNNKNNTNLNNKKERKRLDTTSTTFNASLTTHTTSRSMRDTAMNHHHHHHYHMSHNQNQTNSPSIGMSKSTTSSSQEGHNMYAEIYIRTKKPSKSNKKHQSSYNNNPPPPSGISRDRSTMSSNTNPSLAMTAVSSLSGRSSMFGSTMMNTTNHQQENMPVTPEGHEMFYSLEKEKNGLHQSNNAAAAAGENEYNYFDYDANVEAPLSPLGVSPKRHLGNNVFGSSNHHYHGWSSRTSSRKGGGTTTTSAAIPLHQWKSKVNNLWSSVSKHTCRCFGEPLSNNSEESDRDRARGDGSKTAATSTTAANTSAAAAAVARKMKQAPLFSTPLKEPGLFD